MFIIFMLVSVFKIFKYFYYKIIGVRHRFVILLIFVSKWVQVMKRMLPPCSSNLLSSVNNKNLSRSDMCTVQCKQYTVSQMFIYWYMYLYQCRPCIQDVHMLIWCFVFICVHHESLIND